MYCQDAMLLGDLIVDEINIKHMQFVIGSVKNRHNHISHWI